LSSNHNMVFSVFLVFVISPYICWLISCFFSCCVRCPLIFLKF
jgi:hypothetical protein